MMSDSLDEVIRQGAAGYRFNRANMEGSKGSPASQLPTSRRQQAAGDATARAIPQRRPPSRGRYPSAQPEAQRRCCSATRRCQEAEASPGPVDHKTSEERAKRRETAPGTAKASLIPRKTTNEPANRESTSTTHYTQFLLKLGYKMGPTIGTGSYSKVKIADMLDLQTGKFKEKVACKMIDTRKASKSYATKFLPRELAIIRSIRHPNLVRVKQIVDLGPLVCVFMEFGTQGDLLDYIQKQGAIENAEARGIFRQIAQALSYLHGRGIAHRDLKCENVLRFNDGVVKLTDFGFARGFLDPANGLPVLSRTYCGSMAYAAPEILQAQPYNPTKYDMWSVGCILYIMVTGKMPFSDRSTGQQLEQQVGHLISFPRGSSQFISFACKKLIRDLLNPRPSERPSAEEVLSSPWIKYGGYKQTLRAAGGSVPKGT